MEIALKNIAEIVGGTVEGDENAVVSGFATIEAAHQGCLTFLSNPKYSHLIYDTKATAVLVSRSFVAEQPIAANLIRVDDSYAALAKLMEMVDAMRPRPVGIEPQSFIADGVEKPEGLYLGAFAYVGKGVSLGRNVKIYPQAYIGDGCIIGDDTVIRPGVKIYEGCKIGKRCIIHAGAVIGADGFGFAPTAEGYQKIPQLGCVEIADDVEIGANTTVDRATFGATKVGRGTKLDNLIQIAHNVQLGEHNVIASQTGVAGSAKIGNWNRIGGQVGFAGHISVGDNNEFGAQSGIPGNIGSGRRMIGYPAVDAPVFARQAVYLKRLRELFEKK